MAFSNRIRLPFKLHKPQFLEDATRYRKANGETVTLSVVVRKVYEGLTDRLPEKLHERLKIALVHDSVQVEGDKYVGVVTQDGDYQIEWQDFLDHPLAQGKFKAEVTPFNATNSNCGTCEEMIQVVCNKDQADAPLTPSTLYSAHVLDNDSICCSPVTVSISHYDSNFISAIAVQPDNTIQFFIKPGALTMQDVILFTYRATCPNGQFDEADYVADIDGVAPPACAAPTSLSVSPIGDTTSTVSYTQPSGAIGYNWQLRTMPDNTIVQSGSVGAVDHVDLTGLIPGQAYRFYIQADCDSGNLSAFVYTDFTTTTPPPSDFCGEYELFNNDDMNFRQGTYTDCTGISRNLSVAPLHSRYLCVLQTSPGVPVELNTEPEITWSYTGSICP